VRGAEVGGNGRWGILRDGGSTYCLILSPEFSAVFGVSGQVRELRAANTTVNSVFANVQG